VITPRTTAYSAMVCPSSRRPTSQRYGFRNKGVLLSEDRSTMDIIVVCRGRLDPPKEESHRSGALTERSQGLARLAAA
jgi:hypothetical protein